MRTRQGDEQRQRTHSPPVLLLLLVLFAASLGSQAHADYRSRLPEDEVIYFVLIDRFENGDPSNDRGGLTGDRLRTGFDPTDKRFYHGGDLRGVQRRLDYIAALGGTAIWLSPIYKNKPVQGGRGEESAGYHGYWITDFTQVDPHFGTNDDLHRLVAAAHARDLKVYLDIVTNHTADVIAYRECPERACEYRSRADFPVSAYSPLVSAAEAAIKVPAWLNDPAWYHNRGNTTFRGESTTMGDFAGLDDLLTEHPRVLQGFIEIYGDWIDRFGIDGFRIDTARHVNSEFWQGFIPAMLERARAKGIGHFHIFGEVATSELDVALLARATRVDRMPSVLDFAFRAAALATLAGDAGTDTFARLYDGDALYEGGEHAALRLPTFVSNHDNGRFAHFVRAAFPRASDGEVLKRTQLAHALMMLMRGVPVVYAGDEQGFAGDGGDADAREDLFPSQVAEYNDNVLVGTPATHVASFDRTHPLFREISRLARVRLAHPVLRRGKQVVRRYAEEPGIFAVSRLDQAGEVLLAFNTSTRSIDVNVEVDASSSTFSSIVGACAPAVRAPRSYRMKLAPLSYAVCKSAREKVE